jgi:hypothetical protein
MIALVFEILGAVNFCTAVYYWVMDRNDIMNWLFFLLSSAIMYLNASRYEENE